MTRAAKSIVFAGMMMVMLGAAAHAPEVDQGLAEFRQGRFAEALQNWRQAAASGDARGALYVGVMYDTGIGVGADRQETLAWYRRAADAGSAAGAFNLGVLYDSGIGVAANPEQAVFWYARAAEAGFGRAEYNLGMLYETGTGVPPDRGKAVALFQRAATHGITAARQHLARLGQPVAAVTPVKRNTAEVPRDNSMQDFQMAQKLLLDRGPAEAARAAALFRQSADQHNPLAEYDLGYCYEHGLGVSRDPVQAFRWYRRAMADSSDEALRSMAQLGARNLEGQIRQAQSNPVGFGPLNAPALIRTAPFDDLRMVGANPPTVSRCCRPY